MEWLGEDRRKFFSGSNFHKVVDLTVLSTFMHVLPRSEWKPTSSCPIWLIQVPKCLFWWVESISGTFGVIGWRLEKIFFGSTFSQSCRSYRSEHFYASFSRSEWKTHFHLSDRVESGTKLLVLMSRIHFWNIWSDWVKIGENFFRGQIFTKL